MGIKKYVNFKIKQYNKHFYTLYRCKKDYDKSIIEKYIILANFDLNNIITAAFCMISCRVNLYCIIVIPKIGTTLMG